MSRHKLEHTEEFIEGHPEGSCSGEFCTTVTISQEHYASLIADSHLILAMEVLKVDKHWDGYDDAVEMAAGFGDEDE